MSQRNMEREYKQRAKGAAFMSKLKEIRKSLLMTQEELGRRAKVPQATISRFESGSIFPAQKTIARLADALSVDIGIPLPEAEKQGLVPVRIWLTKQQVEDIAWEWQRQ